MADFRRLASCKLIAWLSLPASKAAIYALLCYSLFVKKLFMNFFLSIRSFIYLMLLLPFFIYSDDDISLIRKELDNKKGTPSKESSLEILNVSYDPTREFYDDYNPLFADWWKKRTNQEITIIQSHGGSGKQARSIISGLEADIVSLALAFDIDSIRKVKGLIDKDWQKRLPFNSSPYYSTIVFLVRKGNPKQIKDWGDLIREGVSVVTPNPKTSGGARWTYLAAWAWALKANGGDAEKTKAFLKNLYANTAVLDTGARGSTTTFIQRDIGDVLLTWENEAYLTIEKTGNDEYEVVYPSLSIKAEPPVTWIDTYIKEKETADAAKFYLKYLYSIPAQELIAKHYFRPVDSDIAEKNRTQFPPIEMVTIDDFGGWEKVQKIHFNDKGIFDEIYLPERK